MARAAIALNLLFFPSIVAAFIIRSWVVRETKKAGVWPTERVFGLEKLRPFQTVAVISRLRHMIRTSEDEIEARRYRGWLNAIFVSYGLGLFAMVVLLAFAPWIFSQVL